MGPLAVGKLWENLFVAKVLSKMQNLGWKNFSGWKEFTGKLEFRAAIISSTGNLYCRQKIATCSMSFFSPRDGVENVCRFRSFAAFCCNVQCTCEPISVVHVCGRPSSCRGSVVHVHCTAPSPRPTHVYC